PLSELLVRSSTGGPGPVSLSPRNRCEHRFRGPTTRSPRGGFRAHVFNAPTQNSDPLPTYTWAGSGPFLAPQKSSEFWADKPFTRCLDRPAEWSFRNPLGSTGGDPNTLAPNR